MFRGKKVTLGITGGIAAYKAADLASRLIKEGHVVDVVMTKNATEFVQPLTFQTITNSPVYLDSFAPIEDFSVEHISLAKRANIVLIAPATANVIGKIACGIADDLLTTVVMAAHYCSLVICPAMNTMMWSNPFVKDNIASLSRRGWDVVGPGTGMLACGDEGAGRLAEPAEIVEFLKTLV